MIKGLLLSVAACMLASPALALNADPGDYLVKLDAKKGQGFLSALASRPGFRVQSLPLNGWVHLRLSETANQSVSMQKIASMPGVAYVQPNYKFRMSAQLNFKKNNISDKGAIEAMVKRVMAPPSPFPMPGQVQDNPEIPTTAMGGSGADPMFDKQWGMIDIGVKKGWTGTPRGRGVVVAVIDTGVDYTHEDLVDSLWRNPGEMGRDASGRDKSTNGVDDDGNGFVDDVVGWDFASDDNKPYDMSAGIIEILLQGGNPGHGTHCAGNVAGHGDNGKGIAGVAPESKIMVLRFLTEKGEGTTDGAVKSIMYAVQNGAHVLSNSWGSEGDDPSDPANQALKDAIISAQNSNVLFIAAAGNGHQGVGYDNDTDAKPAYPASYDMENIISVAAIDSKDAMGSFSNWGRRTVDIAAPGVAVFSTMVSNQYNDQVIDFLGIKATWDGTSMATPHVAGAAALYISAHPGASWQEVKNAIMNTTKPISSMSGKSVSGGKLSVEQLMR